MNIEKEENNHALLFSVTGFCIISLYIERKTLPSVIKVARFKGNINSALCYSEETAFDSNKLAVYGLR